MSAFVSQFVIFVVIWWVVLFAVLPWGIRRQESDEAGHDPGAPANPMLLKKAIHTTIVALVVWGAYFIATHYLGFNLLSLSGMAGAA